jgi:hypothetical protein
MRSIRRGTAAWLSFLFCNKTYPDSSNGSLYRVAAPLVNVSRAPGEWQRYAIILHAPQCRDGELTT